jgi:alkylation response protein AidB-like acyl-CoA dehydrogenase
MKTGGEFLTTVAGSQEIFSREHFSEEQRDFLSLAREFALQEVKEQREAIEKYNPELMRNLFQKAGEIGFLGIDVPEDYGGLSLDKVTSAILTEMVAFGESASFSVCIAAHVSIGTLPIVFFGTPEQKEKHLPQLVSGEKISAYCLTEPTAGSDALSILSTAMFSEDQKHFILNGTKQFITNGGWADLYIVFAKVNGEKFSAFIVDRNTPGVQVGKEENKLGQKGASTCSVTFENVAVPVENVLHQTGRGAEVAFNSLNIGRFKLGAADLGGCKVCINNAMQYALERWQFGQPIAYFDAIKGKFADMVLRTFALDSMIYRTAGLLDQSISRVQPDSPNYFSEVAKAIENHAIECSMCKIAASEALGLNADSGLQVYGGYGFVEEYPMARVTRDARVERLYEGTNEINRQVITGYFLKKAIMEELPIREALQKIQNGKGENLPEFSGPLAAEIRALEIAKSLALLVFHHALVKYGQDVMNQQQIGEKLSDVFTDIYAMDSTISRVNQQLNTNGEDHHRVHLTKTFCAEKILDLAAACEKIIYGTLSGKALHKALAQMKNLREKMILPYNIFRMKSEIAEHLYDRGEYPF